MCRKQQPKKENFKTGRGGKEGFSINVTERRSGGRTCLRTENTLFLWVLSADENLAKIGIFFFPFQLAGSFNQLVRI